MLAPNVIITSLDGPLFHQVHIPPKDRFELFLHMSHIEKAVPSLGRKNDQYIHITIGSKIFSQHGTEEAKLNNPPLSAEFRDSIRRQSDRQLYAHNPVSQRPAVDFFAFFVHLRVNS